MFLAHVNNITPSPKKHLGVLAVRTSSFKSCHLPLLCVRGIKKAANNEALSSSLYEAKPQGWREMRSSSWSPSSCLNGEGPHTIAALYLTCLTRQPHIFWNFPVQSVINKAAEIQRMCIRREKTSKSHWKFCSHKYIFHRALIGWCWWHLL